MSQVNVVLETFVITDNACSNNWLAQFNIANVHKGRLNFIISIFMSVFIDGQIRVNIRSH